MKTIDELIKYFEHKSLSKDDGFVIINDHLKTYHASHFSDIIWTLYNNGNCFYNIEEETGGNLFYMHNNGGVSAKLNLENGEFFEAYSWYSLEHAYAMVILKMISAGKL